MLLAHHTNTLQLSHEVGLPSQRFFMFGDFSYEAYVTEKSHTHIHTLKPRISSFLHFFTKLTECNKSGTIVMYSIHFKKR
jgi:hypothetical protein